MSWSLRRSVAVLALVVCMGAVGLSPASAATGSPALAGTVKFVKRTEPAFNHFMENPTPEFVAWMNQDFWRAEVFSPYFDSKTSWYPHGWMYKDLYAIYNGSSYAKEHPNWILHNAEGQPMYIPWGCSNGSCPQYAADIGNPEFRHAWITEVKASAERGYIGLWIDDVNLEFRVGNGNGEQAAPIDPRTGQPMTETAWQEYVDEFLEEIHRAMPNMELLENSIWYAGGPERWKNPLIKRQIETASYINLERGANDEGLVGGTGPWALKTFLSYIDYVHSLGKGVILDGSGTNQTGYEYALAAYYLISTGNDGLGNGAMTPETWWSAYNYNLGEAQTPRTEWNGLLRRDYTNGIALLNEPGAPKRTVTLPTPMYTTTGTTTTTITLNEREGAVLRYVEAPSQQKGSEQPGKEQPGTQPGGKQEGETHGTESTAPEAAAGSGDESPQTGAPGAGDGHGEHQAPAEQPLAPAEERHQTAAEEAAGGPGSGQRSAGGRVVTSAVVVKERSSEHGHGALLHGRAIGAQGAVLELQLRRDVNGNWVLARTIRVQLGSGGAFRALFRRLGAGRYQAQATLVGAAAGTGSSEAVTFALLSRPLSAASARARLRLLGKRYRRI